MGLDIRLPIGLMFLIVGALLTFTGLVHSDADSLQRSLGVNINLYWGVFLLVFGAIMYLAARKDAKAARGQGGSEPTGNKT